MDTIFVSDIKNNHYLYSYYRKQLIYLNPCLFDLCYSFCEERRSLDEIENTLSYKYSDSEIKNAFKTFEVLRQNSFFNSYTPKTICSFNFSDFDLSGLRVVTFEVTQKCNLQCKYCINGEMYENHEFGIKEHNENLTFEKAMAVIDFVADRLSKGSSVKPQFTFGFYGGEPLLQIELIKRIVDYIKCKMPSFIKILFNMTTNGILLRKHIDFLIENKFQLMVSLDGNRRHSEYRIPKGQNKLYSIIFDNLKFIQKEHPDYFNDYLTFNSVFHDKVSLREMVTFFKKEFGKLPSISELSTTGIKDSKEYQQMFKSSDKAIEAIAEKLPISDYEFLSPRVSYIKKFFNNILIGRDIRNLPNIQLEYAPKELVVSGTCMPFSFKLFVSSTGKLYPCEKIGYKYSIGYIDNNNQVIIDPTHVNELYNSVFSEASNKCSTCYNIYSCTSCLLEHAGNCEYQTKEQFTKRLTDYINDLIKREYI